MTLRLDVPDRPGHRAGQHVDVRLTAEDGYSTQRSYSIASPPGSDRLELTVERIDEGEVSPYLTTVADPGDRFELRGPIGGWFVWDGLQRADAREARQRECKDGAVSNGEPCDKHADRQQVGNTAEASQPAFDAGSTVDLTQFTFAFSIFILAMVVLGGLGSIWRVVVDAIILSAINHHLLPRVLYGVPITLGLDFDLSGSRPASMASCW